MRPRICYAIGLRWSSGADLAVAGDRRSAGGDPCMATPAIMAGHLANWLARLIWLSADLVAGGRWRSLAGSLAIASAAALAVAGGICLLVVFRTFNGHC